MRLTRRDWKLVGALLIAGAAAWTLLAGPVEAATSPNEIVVGVKSDPVSLDPDMGPDMTTYTAINTIHENLIKRIYNEKGELTFAPGLATSWKQVDDRTLEFHLRKGVKFQSGREFTAEDVKISFNRLLDPKAPWPNRGLTMGKVSNVAVVDKYTVRVSAPQPFPPMLAGLAIPGMGGIMDAKRVEELGMNYTGNPSGTGPFKLVEKIKGERTVVERFPSYWGPRSKVGRIVFRPINDDAARMIALQTGEVDMVVSVPPSQIPQLKSAGLRVVTAPATRVMWLSLNTLKGPLTDVRVRQALNYAVDVDKIASDLFKGATKRALSPIAPNVFGYKPTDIYRYDPEKAKKLLTEAGFPNGFEIGLWAPQGRYLLDREVASAIISYLANVGIRVRVELMEWATWSSRVAEQTNEIRAGKKKVPDYDMLLWGNSSPSLDGDGVLTTTFTTGGYWNKSEYSNPRVDELVAKGGSTVDPRSRAQYYAEAQEIIMKEAPCLFLTIEPLIVGMRPNLKGISILPMEIYVFDHAWKE